MNDDTQTPIRLLVVDDHNLFRRGLVALLAQDRRFHVVGEAADASAAQTNAARLQPDLILLDNHLPGVCGIDAIAGLKEVSPQSRIIMLTVSENEEDLAASLRAGADGYLLKTIDTEALCGFIQQVWEGHSVVSPEMMGKLLGLLRDSSSMGSPKATLTAPSPLTPSAAVPNTLASGENLALLAANDLIQSLSPRERETLKLIARGDSNKHIARALGIAETTVKIHVQHIFRKLNLGNRVHAAVYASERGWC